MKKLLMFVSAMAVAAGVFAAVDHGINVWISTDGTNVTYLLGKGPASLDEVRAVVRKVATIDPLQAVHVITDEKTTMASLFAVSKSICDGGLTNIDVSMVCSARASIQSNRVGRLAVMSLEIHDVYDFDLQETNSVRPTNAPCSDPAARPQKR